MAKRSNKANRPFVGDFILTKSTWMPKFKINDKELEIDLKGARIKGVVVCSMGNSYGVRIGPGFNFTDHLNGVLSGPEGVWLSREDFDLVKDIYK